MPHRTLLEHAPHLSSDSVAYLAASASGASAVTALNVANEIAQLIAALVAIASGVASLVYFYRRRNK